jgi:hypothetical protein
VSVRTIAIQAVLVAFGTAAGLAILEIGARVYEAQHRAEAREAWRTFQESRAGEARGELPLAGILRISPNPEIIYELIPNLAGIRFKSQPLRTNARGFRGPEHPEEPAPGTIRIVGIGDSVMFGWGVRERQSYPRILERMLNRDLQGVRVEVINTAVPGYNTAMEVATLEAKGVAFRPDWVIVDFVTNDLGLPNFIARDSDPFSLRRSFLWEFVSARLAGRPGGDRRGPLALAPRHESGFDFASRPDRVPPEYRAMVGLSGYRRAMERLAARRDQHGFRVLVVSSGHIPDDVAEVCRQLAFPTFVAVPDVERYMQQHGIEEYQGSDLTVGESDPHPSAIQHRIIAEGLRRWLASADARLAPAGDS